MNSNTKLIKRKEKKANFINNQGQSLATKLVVALGYKLTQ